MNDHHPRTLPRRPDRPLRLRQVHVRAQALSADRGPLVGLLPRPGLRRRERPGRDRRRLRGAALHRRASGWRAGRLTVVDATNVQPEARKPLVELARQYHCLPVAIVLDLPETTLPGAEPRRGRTATSARTSSASSGQQLRRSLRGLQARGLPPRLRPRDRRRRSRRPRIERQPLWNDREHEHGPFDIIGDVHGCCDELEELLEQLGYEMRGAATRRAIRGQSGLSPSRRAARRSSSATWWTAGRASSTRVRLVRNMVDARHGALRARQPRRQAAAQAAGQGRADHARPGRDAGGDRRAAGRTSRAVPPRRWPSSSTAWSATTSSTTASWSSRTPG